MAILTKEKRIRTRLLSSDPQRIQQIQRRKEQPDQLNHHVLHLLLVI